MIVFGGYIDNGSVIDEMLSLNLETFEWVRLLPKNPIDGFAQAACATVDPKKSKPSASGTNLQGQPNA